MDYDGLWWIMMDYDSDYDGSYYWIIMKSII